MSKPGSKSASAPGSEWNWIGPVIGVIGLAVVFVMAGLNAAGVTPPEVADWVRHAPQHAQDAVSRVGGAVAGTRCALRPCEPATDSLAGLRVEPESHATTYRRAKFGVPWKDVDRNGCDTRDDMLRRDLQDEVTRKTSSCWIGAPVTGTFTDPYSGATVTFNKARAVDVQIDHAVSLGEAWRSGAYAWTDAQRLAYANDPDVLVTTTRQINDAKSDHDAAQPWRECVKRGPTGSRCTGWQDDRPTKARGCTYARRVKAIKTKYALTVDEAEFAALGSLLKDCS